MKKLFLLLALAAGFTTVNAQIRIGGKTINVKKAGEAVGDAAKAITLSDADIVDLCHKSVEWMDAHNEVASESSEYTQRLNRLTKNVNKNINGLTLNFKVYLVTDINAFASGDGSVRVFSSLMDIMDDDELMGVIGHEIGHVASTDVKDAMKNAYMVSAGKKAASATGGVAAAISDSQLGDISESLLNAQFSQKQESKADEFGFNYCVENGFDPYGMSKAFTKLNDLSNGAKASATQKMFSTHPDSAKRAAKMKEKADKYVKSKK